MIQCNKGSWCLSSFLLSFPFISLFLWVYIISLQTHYKGQKNAEYDGFLISSCQPNHYIWVYHTTLMTHTAFMDLVFRLLFFYFQFIVSLKNVVKSVELFRLVSFLLHCQQKAWKYLGLNPPLRNQFVLEKAPPRNSLLSFLWPSSRCFSS